MARDLRLKLEQDSGRNTLRAAQPGTSGPPDLLQLAVEERDGLPLTALRRPLLDPLREHARFRETMAPAGLTPIR